MTGWVSRVTSMFGRWRRLDDRREGLIKAWAWRTEIAVRVGIPLDWVLCPHCGKQSWVMPPHSGDPCPLVMKMAQDLGLKFDAERMSAVRAGVSFEEMTRQMRTHLDDDEEDEL